MPDVDALSDLELQILAFEKTWWKRPGAKEQAIKDLFDLSATRYYQLLGGLINRPEALAQEPQLVNRLRRLRDEGRARRRGQSVRS